MAIPLVVAAPCRFLASAGDPPQLLPAREQMAFTLGFHIVLVPFGIALAVFMLIANYRALRFGDSDALLLARRWSKVAAVLFAVGAVTGTVLSFEMGLLWPRLMGSYGAAVGFPFAIEGLFFFTEAIFISIYIYGWERMRPWSHFWSGVPVVLSGIGGAAAVIAANSWMNQPGGISVRGGRVVGVSPAKVFFNGAFWYEFVHMLLAAYIVAGFLTAGIYAVGMLKGRRDRYHKVGFLISFLIAAVATPVQIFVGDVVARQVFNSEPSKFAAIELLPKTGTHVPETLLGVLVDGRVRYGLPIPDAASILAGFSPSTRIKGLDAIPAAVRPDPAGVSIVHLAFDIMVGASMALLALVAWFVLLWWRKRDMPSNRLFLACCGLSGVVALVTLWAGWTVTEVGRQPWIAVGLLLTRDAVTHAGNLWVVFGCVLALYVAVGTATILVLRSMRRGWSTEGDASVVVPYGPGSGPEHAAEPTGGGAARS